MRVWSGQLFDKKTISKLQMMTFFITISKVYSHHLTPTFFEHFTNYFL
jgi:hypothetical protein